MVGFGSIGKGTLPMIERHLQYDKSRITVLDPKDEGRKALCDKHGVRFIQRGLTKDNYREVLTPLLTEGGGQGFCVNLSVDTGSVDIMELCNELGALYIDTVNEPWLGFYFDKSKGAAARSNYALRETTLAAKTRAQARLDDRRLLLRRQPRHGLVLRQAGAAQCRGGPEAQRARAEDQGRMGRLDASGRRQGHPHRRARHAALQASEAAGGVRQHLVGRGIPVGRHAAGRTRLGHPREMDAGERAHPRDRLRRRDLPDAARRQHARAHLVPDARRAVRLPRHPQRVDLDLRLFHGARCIGRRDLPADLPLRLSSGGRRGALAARDVRLRQDAGEAPHPRGGRDRRRHRRTRRAALRPRQECLLVRLAALHRGDAGSLRRTRTPPPCR